MKKTSWYYTLLTLFLVAGVILPNIIYTFTPTETLQKHIQRASKVTKEEPPDASAVVPEPADMVDPATVSSIASPSLDSDYGSVFNRPSADLETTYPTKGRIIFAPSIDLDGDPTTNPVNSSPVPVVEILDHQGGIVELAVQLDAYNLPEEAVNIPVTFQLYNSQNDLVFGQTLETDTWGAIKAQIPVEDIHETYSYKALALGFGETELRRFHFDPEQVSARLHEDGATLTVDEAADRWYVVTLTSPTPLVADRDSAELTIMRRPSPDTLDDIKDQIRGVVDDIDTMVDELPPISMPTVVMDVVSTYEARARVQLPAGDYGFIGMVEINDTINEYFHSEAVRIQVQDSEAVTAETVYWASEVDYEPGRRMVIRENDPGKVSFDLVNTEDLPAIIEESYTAPKEFVNIVRTGPFQWREERYDVAVNTLLDDGKKSITLHDFTYDPLNRRYTIAVESLQDTVITDTMRIDVFGPGDQVLMHEGRTVVLKPGDILYYDIDVPSHLGEPERIRVGLDDPILEDLRAIIDAARTIANTADFNVTKLYIKAYADILREILIEVKYDFVSGETEFKTPLWDSIRQNPFRTLINMAEAAGQDITIFKIRWGSLLWDVFTGKFFKRDKDGLVQLLEKILAGLTIRLGGLNVAVGADVSFSLTADPTTHCPDPEDIQAVKDNLQELALLLDSQVAGDAFNVNTRPKWKIPIVGWIAIYVGSFGARAGTGFEYKPDFTIALEGEIEISVGASVVLNPFSIFELLKEVVSLIGGNQSTDDFFANNSDRLKTLSWFAIAKYLLQAATTIKRWNFYYNLVKNVLDQISIYGDCDPDPPDPRPPDDRQDVWQGVESFYEGETHAQTIDNLSNLIQRSRSLGLSRAEVLLTLRLRQAELLRFMDDNDAYVDYAADTFGIYAQSDFNVLEIITQTVPLSSTEAISEAILSTLDERDVDLANLPYIVEQERLENAVLVAEQQFLALQGQDLELQRELRELFTADTIGILATGFAEATQSSTAAMGLPSQLVSPWPGSGEFRGQPAPYLAPGLAPRVVVIPSGGLHAISLSTEARDWIDAYVSGGGMLIVFTQAFGEDWSALPGGEVDGVGYEEDSRWQHATVEATQPSDWLVWMGRSKPDIQIDGAFTSWPSDANVLLKRTFGNYAGYPVLLEYGHGEGTVLATTAYGDWAWQTNFWWGDDARFTHSILIRAYLLARGQDVNDVFAGDPATSVSVSFPLSNTASVSTTQVRLQIPLVWGSGSNSSVATVPASIAPGTGANLSANIPLPPVRRGVHDWTQVGLYRVRMTVSTADGNSYQVWGPFVYNRSPVNPPALSGALQVKQSPVSLFGTAVVTASVRNFTSVARTVTLSPTNDLPTNTLTLTVPANGTATHVYNLNMDSSKAPGAIFYDEANEVVGRANMNIQVAYPELQAVPQVPAAMADGVSIPVVVTNKARQGQALSSSVAMTLTEPSGAAVWTETQPLPTLAAGDTTTPTFTVSLADVELGTYQLTYRVDDGRNLARTSSVPIPSSLVLESNFDRGSYRIRETGVLSIVLTNSGRFDLDPALTVSAPDINISDTQSVTLPVGDSQTFVFPFTVPDTLDNGEYETVVSYQVGGQTVTRTMSLQIPQSRVLATMDQTAYAAGDNAIVALSNSGGVDALVTGTLYLVDVYGSTIATDTISADVLAGQGTTVTLAIPGGAIEGDYYIELIGLNNESGAEVNLARHLDITGLAGDLTVYTGQPDYYSDEQIATFADILLGSGSVNDGDLTLRICSPNADDGIINQPAIVNYDYESTTIDWIDIASGGELVARGLNTYQLVDIGFPFEFYGVTYTQMYVGSNGYITFGSGNSANFNQPIPNVGNPNNAIYALWDYLYPAGGAYGNIFYQQIDANRTVVQWEEVQHCCTTTSPETFQVILDGSDNSITLQYLDVTTTSSATVGVEDASGSSAVQIAYNQAGVIVDNSAFRLSTTEVQVPETTYNSASTSFDWIDIASGGAPVARGLNTYQVVDLGFPFQFYGITYTQMYVGSNGYVSFGSGNTANFNQAIPSASTPNNVIYAFWDYLYPAGGAYGSIYAKQTGPEQYVVQWDNVMHCCTTGSPETFQIVLDGSDDSITLQYQDVTSVGSATVGVENQSGTDGLQISFDQTDVISDGLAIRLDPGMVPVQQINYVDSSAVLDWTDISATGTIVAQSDDTYTAVNIGFPFQFYGITYTQMFVGSNGYVSFGNGYTDYSNSDIPSPSVPNNAIYAFWDDLSPSGGSYGNVYSEQISPTVHIVQWQAVNHYGGGSPETFQVVLDGSDNSITLQYQDVTASSSATVGVENAAGSQATKIAYNQAGIIVDGAAFRLEPISQTVQAVTYLSTTVPLSWTNVAPDPGTQIVSLGRNTYELVSLGFPFQFYGITETQMYVGSNGYVSFGSGNTANANTSLPSSSIPNNSIYAFWDYLNPIGGSDGVIYTKQVSPTLYVVQWEGVEHCCTTGSPETFQIVLDGSDNSITLQYEDVTNTGSATVGVENTYGNIATQLSFNQTGVISDSTAFRLTASTELVTRTTYLTASVPISWTDVAPDEGTQVVSVGYNTYEQVPIGFSFDFYGQDYTDLFVGSNGFVSFGVGNGSNANTTIPSFGTPNNAIYALWDYLYPIGGDFGHIYTRQIDPDRFVIQWDGVAHCCSTAYTETFQIVLDNSDDSITLQYDNVSLTSGATVGVENDFGGRGTQIAYNQTGVINSGSAFRLTPLVEEQPPPPICDPTQPLPLEVVLVIDRSGSMGGQPIIDARNAAVAFLDFMDLSIDRAALVSFESVATLNQSLTQDQTALTTAINSLVAGGGTRIDLGIQVAHQELATNGDPAATPVIILLSDGVSSGDPIAAASAAKSEGIRIISIGLGSGADANTLQAVASTPDDYYFAPSSIDLQNIFESIGNAICRSPLPYDLSCGGYVLWETTLPVTTTSTFNASEIVDPLDISGRMILDGRLFAETGQPVAQDQYPFYLHDRDTALTLETDKNTYYTGETIQVSGQVTNTSSLTLTTDLEVWGNSQLLIDQPLTLAPGEGYTYTTALTDTAAMTETLVTFVAIANGLSVYRPVLVASPAIAGELTAPPVVSRDPFSATLIVSNTSQIAAALQLSVEGQPATAVSLDPGSGFAVDATVQTLVDATLSGDVSGDVNQTLTTSVIQGELAQVTLLPPASNLAGPIEIPYQIDGTGLLEADGVFTLEANGQVLGTQVFAVQPGQTTNGTIVVTLPAGKYTLTGELSDQYGLFDNDTLDVTLLAPAQPAVPDITGINILVPPTAAPAGGTVDVTIEVTNDGAGAPIVIGVQLFGPEEQIIVTPPAHETTSYTFELPVPADLPADDYFGEATVDGQSVPFTVAVAGIDVEMSLALDQTVYNPGEVATLTVTLTDLAGVTADYLVMPRYLTAEDYYTVTIPANTTVQYTFPFTATESDRVNVFLATTSSPPDYERRVLTLDSLPVQVLSPDRGATVEFDKLVYDPGDTVNVTVNVTGTLSNLFVMGPMERTIDNNDVLVWNGPIDPEALLTFIIPGTYNLSTTLPTTMKEGRYTFLVGINNEIYTYPIDVTGYKVTTRHFEVDKTHYDQQDTITAVAEFWNEGDTPITGLQLEAWIITPDGNGVLSLTPAVSQTVDLDVGLNVLSVSGQFDTPDVGPHRILLNLKVPGQAWRVAGAVGQFNVGWASLVELGTDKGTYAVNEAATGRLDVYGFGPTDLTVTLANDGSTLFNQTVDLDGFQTFSFTVPTTASDDYLLVANSVDQGGNEDELTFVYGVPAPADFQAPQIVFNEAFTDTILVTSAPTTTYTISGTVTDNNEGTLVIINGEVYTPTVDGDFTADIDVYQGYNAVVITVVDNYGNYTSTPTIVVEVIPEHFVTLSADRDTAQIEDQITFQFVLSTTAPISDVTAAQFLPDDIVSNVEVVSATAGLADVVTDTGSIGLYWYGSITEPVTVTLLATVKQIGTITTAVDTFWGYGLGEKSNEVSVNIIAPTSCALYPIAVHTSTLDGLSPGDYIEDLFNGSQPGNFGWLTWNGDVDVPTLAQNLTPPSDSDTYVNPNDPTDNLVSAGDWVQGSPGVSNSSLVRTALDSLILADVILLPVWDVADNSGANTQYHITGFVRVRLLDYNLPGTNTISAQYVGNINCGG